MFVKDAKSIQIPANGTEQVIFRNVTFTHLLLNSITPTDIQVKKYQNGVITTLIEKMPLTFAVESSKVIQKGNYQVPQLSILLGLQKLEDTDQIIVEFFNTVGTVQGQKIGVVERSIGTSVDYHYNRIKQQSFKVTGCISIIDRNTTDDEINLSVDGFKVSLPGVQASLLSMFYDDDVTQGVIFHNDIPLDLNLDTDNQSPDYVVVSVKVPKTVSKPQVKYSKIINSNTVANKLVKVGALPQPIHYNQMEA